MDGKEKVDIEKKKEALDLFLEVYSLPKFADAIKDTAPDSPEREEKNKRV
jgi:hypothetical protein